MEIEIPYEPRWYQDEAHEKEHQNRFGVEVWHRRAGKTVRAINRLIRSCMECELERPRVGYICPLLKQAKQVCW